MKSSRSSGVPIDRHRSRQDEPLAAVNSKRAFACVINHKCPAPTRATPHVKIVHVSCLLPLLSRLTNVWRLQKSQGFLFLNAAGCVLDLHFPSLQSDAIDHIQSYSNTILTVIQLVPSFKSLSTVDVAD